MAKAKFKDFDAMFAEMSYETIPFKAFGKHYTIQKAVPAALVLEMAKYESEKEIPEKMIIKFGRQIFGEKLIAEWSKRPDFTADKLGILIRWAFQATTGNNEEDEDEEPEEITEDDMGESGSKGKRKN